MVVGGQDQDSGVGNPINMMEGGEKQKESGEGKRGTERRGKRTGEGGGRGGEGCKKLNTAKPRTGT